MRRRELPPADMPPAELLTFTASDWVPFVEIGDPRRSTPFGVWSDARHRWSDRYGWPQDTVEMYRDQVAQLMASMGEVQTDNTPPTERGTTP